MSENDVSSQEEVKDGDNYLAIPEDPDQESSRSSKEP